jgi:DNA-binding response OmpR family regulator
MQLQEEARILIVHNDAAIQSLYGDILGSKNYLSQKCTFEQVSKAVSDFVPHLIIMHLDFDFYSDALESLRRVYQTHGTERPLVLLTVPKDCLDSSFDAFIEKRMFSPVDPDEFLSNVGILLRKKL